MFCSFIFKILFTSIFIFFLFSGQIWAWELHNFSKEKRVFDEFRDSGRTPYSKTVHPGGSVSFPNSPRVTVIDQKTGQKINNPSFKMMEVTKEGYLRIR
jgi:hypothetical protein